MIHHFQFFFSDGHTVFYQVVGFSTSTDDPFPQFIQTWWGKENEYTFRNKLPDLKSTLHFDFEHDIVSVLRRFLDIMERSTVIIPYVLRPFEQFILFDHLFKRFL